MVKAKKITHVDGFSREVSPAPGGTPWDTTPEIPLRFMYLKRRYSKMIFNISIK